VDATEDDAGGGAVGSWPKKRSSMLLSRCYQAERVAYVVRLVDAFRRGGLVGRSQMPSEFAETVPFGAWDGLLRIQADRDLLLRPASRCPGRTQTSDTRSRKPLLNGLGIGIAAGVRLPRGSRTRKRGARSGRLATRAVTRTWLPDRPGSIFAGARQFGASDERTIDASSGQRATTSSPGREA
jgi:hypothetical protein